MFWEWFDMVFSKEHGHDLTWSFLNLSSYFVEFFWKTGHLILAFSCDIYGVYLVGHGQSLLQIGLGISKRSRYCKVRHAQLKSREKIAKLLFEKLHHHYHPMWVQSGTFVCSFIVLNLNVSFNFCARLGFNVIWLVKCIKIRKLKIEIISI